MNWNVRLAMLLVAKDAATVEYATNAMQVAERAPVPVSMTASTVGVMQNETCLIPLPAAVIAHLGTTVLLKCALDR